MKHIFQKWLFLFVLFAFIVTCGVVFVIQTKEAERTARDMIQLRIDDAKAEVVRNTNNLNIIRIQNRTDSIAKAHSFAEILRAAPGRSDVGELQRLLRILNVDELNVINAKGIITFSSVEKYIGYNMGSAEQSAEFMVLLDDPYKEIVQEPRPIGFDSDIKMQYAGVARLDAKGFVQIGYLPRRLMRALEIADISSAVSKFRIGRSGGMLLAKNSKIVASEPSFYVGKDLSEIEVTQADVSSKKLFGAVMQGERQLCISELYGDLHIIGYMSESEIYAGRQSRMLTLTMCLLLIFTAIFVLISRLVQNVVIKGINDINATLALITGGDLDSMVQVMTNKEFVSLSCGINSMVEALKSAIAEAKGRIDAELQVAKAIQHSALPEVLRLPLNGADFEISAEMYTAKEVGGDFYDCFFTDSDHLVFTVADVSGKGIPAALFMMKCKTLINSIAESETSPAAILSEANERLCEGNEMEMFVTVWLGILEISSGCLRFANAGHNLPLIARSGGAFEYLAGTSGLVLGGMEGVKYKEFELKLDRGDALFLYTDGVTEAIDGNENAYGYDRLKALLDTCRDRGPSSLTKRVKEDLSVFTKGEPQFDDVTIFALRVLISPEKELAVAVSMESYDSVLCLIEEALTALGCPMQSLTEINIAIDEIFSNIVRYSGATQAVIRCGVRDKSAIIRISDDGHPYDPLQNSDPDTTQAAEDREIGGLGIFIVKQIMDSVVYEYRDGKNTLKIEKKFIETKNI